MIFRLLRADEIDARIATCGSWGVQLLLYKDARCDMNILDETVGAFNWQRRHKRNNANCIVSIWDSEKGQWIEKEDTGTESNTEREKGLASDSFKRACFNWGIGRELYTAPQMFVRAADLKTLEERNGKWTCRDAFQVEDVQYSDRAIVYVRIRNLKTGKEIEYGEPSDALTQKEALLKQPISATKALALQMTLGERGVNIGKLLSQYGVDAVTELTEGQHMDIINRLQRAEK